MNLLRLAIVPKIKRENERKLKLGFEKKSGPTKHTTHFHVHGDSQIVFLLLLLLHLLLLLYFGPSPFLAIRYSLTKKKTMWSVGMFCMQCK